MKKYNIITTDTICELDKTELLAFNGGAYPFLDRIIYGINYAVSYASEIISQGNIRSASNLADANNNTMFGHYGGARP